MFFGDFFEQLLIVFFCWQSLDPYVCFLTVLLIVFLSACLCDFLLLTTSNNSGTFCRKSSCAISFAVERMKPRARPTATRPIPAANASKPLPLCLQWPEKCGKNVAWLG